MEKKSATEPMSQILRFIILQAILKCKLSLQLCFDIYVNIRCHLKVYNDLNNSTEWEGNKSFKATFLYATKID